jgi:hypothetical protein
VPINRGGLGRHVKHRKGGYIVVVDHRSSLKERDRRSGRIMGPEHDGVLIFPERAAIETTILPKDYLALCSELWGEN